MKIKSLIPAVIIAAAAAICAAAAFSAKESKGCSVAYIYQNGEEIERVPLDGSTDGKTVTISDESGNKNVIEVENGKIHMKEANCKDQLCVKMGYRSSEDTPIVCLPNRVVIVIKDEENDK